MIGGSSGNTASTDGWYIAIAGDNASVFSDFGDTAEGVEDISTVTGTRELRVFQEDAAGQAHNSKLFWIATDRTNNTILRTTELGVGQGNLKKVFVHDMFTSGALGSVIYAASPNGGSTFENIEPNKYHEFSTAGSALRLRFTFNTSSTTGSEFAPYVEEYATIWGDGG